MLPCLAGFCGNAAAVCKLICTAPERTDLGFISELLCTLGSRNLFLMNLMGLYGARGGVLRDQSLQRGRVGTEEVIDLLTILEDQERRHGANAKLLR